MNLITQAYINMGILLFIGISVNILLVYLTSRWVKSKTNQNYGMKDVLFAYLTKSFNIKVTSDEVKNVTSDEVKKVTSDEVEDRQKKKY